MRFRHSLNALRHFIETPERVRFRHSVNTLIHFTESPECGLLDASGHAREIDHRSRQGWPKSEIICVCVGVLGLAPAAHGLVRLHHAANEPILAESAHSVEPTSNVSRQICLK
jgi:hypothetical protein